MDRLSSEPSANASPVTVWLTMHADDLAPVVHPDPRTAPVLVFDFSPTTSQWNREEISVPLLASDELFARMREAGVEIGVGRYDEERLVYTADQFQTGDEPRTVHLGIDLFQPAGSPVFAPLDGTVHSFADNALPLDYGPTIILEHAPVDGPTFWTLYGHLSRTALGDLAEGQQIAKGKQIGTLGAPKENGGWAPHLHFQLITDLLGRRGDFPGVGTVRERAIWKSLSPNPNLVSRIPSLSLEQQNPVALRGDRA